MIDTKRVTDRRTLRFETFDQLRADLANVERSDAAGTLRRTGNWTLGQITAHLAAWINYSYDGFPPEVANPPWIVRLIVGFLKNGYLNKGMPTGVKIPKLSGGTLGQEPVTSAEGLRRVRAAIERLEKSGPTLPSPIFGPLSHDEWKRLNLRHAELHLSFVHPA